jgi:hypothetical protein
MGHLKEDESTKTNADKFMQMYVAEKSVVFKSFAEEHKKDVQMMEYVKKACEELYLLLFPSFFSFLLSYSPLGKWF